MDLEVDGQTIDSVECFKFLGISIDNTLHFEKHYSSLHSSLLKSSSVIKILGKSLPTCCLRTLYFAYFHSNLVYGLCIWYPLLSKCRQDALYVLQKCITHSICKVLYRQHCMPLFKNQKILSLQDQILLDNCKLITRLDLGEQLFSINKNNVTCCPSVIIRKCCLQ